MDDEEAIKTDEVKDLMQANRITQISMIWIATLLTVSISACGLKQHQHAVETERLLSAAGFQMRLADTPAKLAQVKNLPQRKMIPQQKDGRTQYVYADADFCKCIYAGSESAYKRYLGLARQREIAAEERIAADRDQPAQIDWGDWNFEQNW